MQRTTNQPDAAEISATDTRTEGSSAPNLDARSSLEKMPLLSSDELRQREAAVRFANASIGLEGFTVTDEARVRADRFIAGEIDLCEFLQNR